jgi:hypothetical protein
MCAMQTIWYDVWNVRNEKILNSNIQNWAATKQMEHTLMPWKRVKREREEYGRKGRNNVWNEKELN